MRRRPWQHRLYAGVLLAVAWCGVIAEEAPRRLIVLGVDGMDPDLLRGYMAAGDLPNMTRLAESGGFMALGTSVPPLSPVAWSDFITGMDAGGHGIFDFIALNRATLKPELSIARVEWLGFDPLELGRWSLPLGTQRTRSLRAGTAFWELLEDHDVPAVIFQMPTNYPPVRAGQASLSGMGTPDLRGTPGTYYLYTDDPSVPTSRLQANITTRVSPKAGVVSSVLEGPPNLLRAGVPPSTVPFRVSVDAVNPVALIEFGDDRAVLQVGEWSDWLRVRFELVPGLVTVPGMVQVLLQQTAPHFRLFIGPINIDPRDPAQTIAEPAGYSRALADAAGPFSTIQMPEAARALKDGLISPAEFVAQSGRVLDERRRLLGHELQRFRTDPGKRFLFFYISSLDQRHHMLARDIDPEHPYRPANRPATLRTALRDTYREIDGLVGSILAAADAQTTVAVLSDHGFASFRRQANLNRWLELNGYLRHQGPLDQRARYRWLDGMDWTRTRAFAVGLNSLYLNVRGRERDGIVDPAQRQALARKIAGQLLAWRDPLTQQPVVTQALLREEAYQGAHVSEAPDIIVGYARGYRVSWGSATGQVFPRLLEDNLSEWSGDHAMDSRAVPGVLLVNRPLRASSANLRDMPVTILHQFGIEAPAQMHGRVIF